MQARGGHTRGKPQPHKRASYDPSTGKAWRTGLSLKPETAVKAIKAAELAEMSVAGLLEELIRRLPVDAEGRPTWAPPPAQTELPLAG